MAPTRDPRTEYLHIPTTLSLREITQRVYGFPLVTNFKMQSNRAGTRATHGSDFLPGAHFLLFPYQHRVVMGVGAQVIIIMFDDYQITVPSQSVTGIDDSSAGGGQDGLSA